MYYAEAGNELGRPYPGHCAASNIEALFEKVLRDCGQLFAPPCPTWPAKNLNLSSNLRFEQVKSYTKLPTGCHCCDIPLKGAVLPRPSTGLVQWCRQNFSKRGGRHRQYRGYGCLCTRPHFCILNIYFLGTSSSLKTTVNDVKRNNYVET